VPGCRLRDGQQVSGRVEEPRDGAGVPRRDLRRGLDEAELAAVDAFRRRPRRRGHRTGVSLIKHFLRR
jgi:hypothetical protein